jgi:N-acylneuraminate cytidylyltransferase
MKTLILIPARAGSKGLPGKNTKLFWEKPLIVHTIEFAEQIKVEGDIVCVSSNDDTVIEIAKRYTTLAILRRPDELSTDSIGMNDVLLHALLSLDKQYSIFDRILLLQPTSPIRSVEDYKNICRIFDEGADLAVSVKESKANPYFNLFEENSEGFLEKSKKSNFERRQDCPSIYEYNGSMYLVSVTALIHYGLHGMKKIKKLIMTEERSVDIDNIKDWEVASFFYEKIRKLNL